MTVREILAAMLRRWYIPVGILACAALVTVMLARDGGVYTASTVVTLMRSSSTSLSPNNGADDSSVVAYAGAVVNAINNGRPPARYSMDDAPYYGAGVREGVRVDLADAGNQWVSAFSRSDVELQIVGRSLDGVRSQQDQLVDLVLSFADAEQAVLMIPEEDRITAVVAPLTTQIEYVHASRDSQFGAAGAMLAAALILGAWGSVAGPSALTPTGCHTPARPRFVPSHPGRNLIMNLADTLRGLWRRWYIVVPGILIAAVLAVSVWTMIPPWPRAFVATAPHPPVPKACRKVPTPTCFSVVSRRQPTLSSGRSAQRTPQMQSWRTTPELRSKYRGTRALRDR
ncbi:hypothetical protein [Cryobacterium sp.]|jgi:hypothetical protein|uniref:hypothetical protein n=1 Tax=Cryobacterium sp. TaxID=1926290 RepID=UPI002609E235|nr:hypothetical protein [Cryobacterium sp.]MCU1447371.1 hypothetical protein [Cryobacterium sp.]